MESLRQKGERSGQIYPVYCIISRLSSFWVGTQGFMSRAALKHDISQTK